MPQARRCTERSQIAVASASPARWRPRARAVSREAAARALRERAVARSCVSRAPGYRRRDAGGGPSGSRQMWPKWPARPRWPAEQAALAQDRAADAGAESQQHDVAAAGGRALPGLAEERRLRVVQHADVARVPRSSVQSSPTSPASRPCSDRHRLRRRRSAGPAWRCRSRRRGRPRRASSASASHRARGRPSRCPARRASRSWRCSRTSRRARRPPRS